MSASIFSETELARLASFPKEIPSDDRIRAFTLSGADRDLVVIRRGAANRLGLALQLCALRYLGFVPRNLSAAPRSAACFVADQLEVSPDEIQSYARREQTRRQHFTEVREHLGFSMLRSRDVEELEAWLVERALEHDAPKVLFRLARERLRTERLVFPAPDRIVRLVSSARGRAQERTYTLVEPLLSAERRARLDGLLEAKASNSWSTLKWLGQGASGESPGSIKSEVAKLAFLRQLGAHEWDLSDLNPNRRKFLAQVGRRSTSQTLQRMPDRRRYPILVALLHETTLDLVDEIVDLFNRALKKTDSRSRRELEAWRVATAQATHEKVRLFSRLGRLVLDPDIPDEQLRRRIFEEVASRELFAAAVEETEPLLRPRDGSYLDFVENRYGHLRKFAPLVLRVLDFKSLKTDDPLIDAVEILRELNRKRRRRVPEDAGLEFASAKWRGQLLGFDGRVNRRSFELCVLYPLRDGLRSGAIWLQGSRRFADPATYLIPSSQWTSRRSEALRILGLEQEPGEHLEALANSTEAVIQHLDETEITESETLRLEEGRIVLSPSSMEELPDEVVQLNDLVAERLPRVELAEVLIEVDSWTGFTQFFRHAGGARSRNPDLVRHVDAAILAQACNFGLTTMADIADWTYRQLAWTTDWYLREETLKAAFSALVDFQHPLPLAEAWGGGTLSSSDGQRFPVRGSAENATALPKYFGLGRGLTFYTWTSDQYSQYGSKVILSTVRDASYVLDEILDNQTDLPILEHTTDTAGYTEIVFALFHLLGLQFVPRIRDLGAQRLYRLDAPPRKEGVAVLLKGLVRSKTLLDNWDELLRVAGSLKLGWVTASLLSSKLQAGARENVLSRALRDLGRLVKTPFILRWIENPDYRRRIHRQLNKGEALHALRRFLFFAHEGKLQRRQADQQTNQVLCLNLVTNAIVTWNTVYMNAAIERLRAEGRIGRDIDLGHLSPALYGHVNPYGKYRFEIEGRAPSLRPLRSPGNDA